MKKKMRQDLFLDKVKEGQAVRHIDRRAKYIAGRDRISEDTHHCILEGSE